MAIASTQPRRNEGGEAGGGRRRRRARRPGRQRVCGRGRCICVGAHAARTEQGALPRLQHVERGHDHVLVVLELEPAPDGPDHGWRLWAVVRRDDDDRGGGGVTRLKDGRRRRRQRRRRRREPGDEICADAATGGARPPGRSINAQCAGAPTTGEKNPCKRARVRGTEEAQRRHREGAETGGRRRPRKPRTRAHPHALGRTPRPRLGFRWKSDVMMTS